MVHVRTSRLQTCDKPAAFDWICKPPERCPVFASAQRCRETLESVSTQIQRGLHLNEWSE
jgi:hypothetical protein